METVEQIITDEQLNEAWGNANFGERFTKREVVANSLLKYASGYSTGHTALCICQELGLVTQQGKKTVLTLHGKRYLWVHYSKGVLF